MEQVLDGLIPTHSSPLPRELVELARSLLAQSRSKAANLKQEEEIAREYVCANIACERLKRSLNLPKIQPKPPIPPRSYRKLYEYFDRTLVISRTKAAIPTPTHPQVPVGRNTPITKSTQNTPSNITSIDTSERRPPRSLGRRRGLLVDNTEKTIPNWIRPLINAICISLESPAAAPHVLAGVTTILTVPSPSALLLRSQKGPKPAHAPEQDKTDKIPALIAAVFVHVCTKLRGETTSGAEYYTGKNPIVRSFNKAKKSLVERGFEMEGWEDFVGIDVDAWLKEIPDKRWVDLDWFSNIELGAGVDGDVRGEGELGTEERQVEKRPSGGTSLRGMLQNSVDYLSEEKRKEYQVWRSGIMRRIEEIEAEDGYEDLEMDA